MTVIEFENVSKSYEKDKPVIKNLDLKVKRGEFITILGTSGNGKQLF